MKKYYYFNDPTNMGQESIGANNAPLNLLFKEINVEDLKINEDRLVAIDLTKIVTEEEWDFFCEVANLGRNKNHCKYYTMVEN